MAINQVTLSGRLVKDVELKTVNENLSVLNFTLAVDRKYKKDGNKEVDFIPCAAFNKDKLANYMLKGKQIIVTGSIQIDKYKDKDGNNRSFTKVIASQIELLGGKKEEAQLTPPDFSAIDDSEMPF